MSLHSPLRRAGRIATVSAAALALLVSLPGAATAAPGDLDPTFSGDGKVITDTAAIEDSRDVVIQPDGKIVTLGIGFDFDGPNDFILVRYNPDGTLDTTFGGGDGIVHTDFGGSTDDEAHALTLAGPGKIVAVGRSDTADGGRPQLAAARYNADGSLDTTFDGDGKVVTSFGGTVPTIGNAVLMGTDDNILIGGSYGGDAMVTRLTASGGLDVFGDDNSGKAVFPFAGGDSAIHSLAVYGGETIIAGGSSPAGFGLVRLYMEFGGRDATFGDNGQVSTPFGNAVEGVELAAGGKIVAAGSHGTGVSTQFAVARYDGNGDLDPTFAGDGTVTTGFGGNGATGHDMALQDDDKIVVAGVANGDFALARFTTAGTLDSDFGGGDGRVTTDFEGNWDEGRAVALQTDGRIVVAGNGSDNHAVARYSVTGTPVPPTVDLAVTKTGPATISIGDQATYTVRVTNRSTTATATGVSVSDTLTGASGTLLSATPGQGGPCTVNATTMTCALGAIAPGATAIVTVVAEPRATGTLTDRVTTTAAEADPVPANNTATATTTVNNARGCTIIGRSTGETLTGTFGNDVICALSGNDTVNGGGGNDTVHAGPGNDVVNGGNGGDRLIGQSGNDRLNGDSGNDNLDTRDGVTGNDQAFGGLGFDTCTTDAGDTRNSCP
ncbi:calcium-binding protein [Streptomyces sp. NPDC056527]|uniref:calcium-binding protein n=1 Tax=Streptomyces sp. NPDC056527 TaxID=3345853 RepID=UPI0036C9203E